MKTSIGSVHHSGRFAKFLTLCIIFLALSCTKDEPVATPTPTPTPTKSSAKDITKFSFVALSPAVEATIDATAKTIKATVPTGTDATKLVPTITVSDKAILSPATGVAQDFSKEVSYTVTAEDASTAVYKVTVTVTPAPVVTAKTIDSNSIPEVLEDLGDGVDYIVKTNITISGTKVITVKPGVKIQFEGGDAGFTISSQGALKMIGTSAKPIILEGKVATAGSWKGISIEAKNIENQWEYVTLRHAGGGTDKAGLFLSGYDNAIRISLKNCIFSDNSGYGILHKDEYFDGIIFTAFQKNTFTNNTKSALKISHPQMGSLDSESKYADNGQKYIEAYGWNSTAGVVVNDDITIKKLDVPYRVSDIILPKGNLIINAGVEIQFTTDAGIFLQDSYKNAAIIAEGTESQPIKFVGYLANTKGLWAGIGAQNQNQATKLNYCIVDGAGSQEYFCVPKSSKAAIYIGLEYSCTPRDSRGAVTNCTISNSGGYGIAYRNGDAVTVSNIIFKDNTKDNTYLFK